MRNLQKVDYSAINVSWLLQIIRARGCHERVHFIDSRGTLCVRNIIFLSV